MTQHNYSILGDRLYEDRNAENACKITRNIIYFIVKEREWVCGAECTLPMSWYVAHYTENCHQLDIAEADRWRASGKSRLIHRATVCVHVTLRYACPFERHDGGREDAHVNNDVWITIVRFPAGLPSVTRWSGLIQTCHAQVNVTLIIRRFLTRHCGRQSAWIVLWMDLLFWWSGERRSAVRLYKGRSIFQFQAYTLYSVAL